MSQTIYELLLLFLIYSFLGWCAEVSFVAVTSGKVVNRGFLEGPVCPIYGVGMLAVLLLLGPESDNLAVLFVLGMLLCSLVELIGGWILERVFHTRWWDYSDKPFNLGGYICLEMSLLWGLAVTFVVRLVHPLLMRLILWLPVTLGWVLIGVLYALFVTDLILTLITLIGLRRKLGELERVADALRSVGDVISDRLGNTALAADEKLGEVRQTSQEKLAEGKEKLAGVREASQEKLAEAKQASQERRAENREKWEEAKALNRRKLAEGKEALDQRVAVSTEELQQKKQLLEQRQRELLGALGDASVFGARRLGGAFPRLKQDFYRRIKDYSDKARSEDKSSEQDGD